MGTAVVYTVLISVLTVNWVGWKFVGEMLAKDWKHCWPKIGNKISPTIVPLSPTRQWFSEVLPKKLLSDGTFYLSCTVVIVSGRGPLVNQLGVKVVTLLKQGYFFKTLPRRFSCS